MRRNYRPINTNRTHGKKGIIIFSIISFFLSLGVAILFIILKNENVFFRWFAIIVGSFFAILSLIVLLIHTTVYLEIKDNNLVYHRFFVKKTIACKQIKKLVYNSGSYALYLDNDQLLFVIDSSDVGAQTILSFLEKHKVQAVYK